MQSHKVTMLRSARATVDRNNNTIPDWVNPERLELRNALVAPRSSSDLAGPERTGVIIGLTLYVRSVDVVLQAGDRFEIGGQAYEVEGVPGVWGVRGVEVALKRVEG